MTTDMKVWEVHQAKSETSLNDAEFLCEHGRYDGAYSKAFESCLQSAMAFAERLRLKNDPEEWRLVIRKMTMDGRLPPDFLNPFYVTIRARNEHFEGVTKPDAINAKQAIECAELFHKTFYSAALLAESKASPGFKKAVEKYGPAIGQF